jgi:ADP-ribose pyrophosphatase YjhB (NUDIX family)
VKEHSILLCKRAIEPRYGKWTLPGGFLENGETVSQGAFRETFEETNTEVEMGELYAIFNVPQINQVYMLYLAKVVQDDYSATTESLEVQFFQEDEIPWKELAFPFVPIVIKKFYLDLKTGEFPLTTHTIERKK